MIFDTHATLYYYEEKVALFHIKPDNVNTMNTSLLVLLIVVENMSETFSFFLGFRFFGFSSGV